MSPYRASLQRIPILTRREQALLRGVMERAAVDERMDEGIAANEFTRSERAYLVGLIANEFCRVGLEAGDEPNPLGIELETLLDHVNRPNLVDP